jgi:hypothetical protein
MYQYNELQSTNTHCWLPKHYDSVVYDCRQFVQCSDLFTNTCPLCISCLALSTLLLLRCHCCRALDYYCMPSTCCCCCCCHHGKCQKISNSNSFGSSCSMECGSCATQRTNINTRIVWCTCAGAWSWLFGSHRRATSVRHATQRNSARSCSFVSHFRLSVHSRLTLWWYAYRVVLFVLVGRCAIPISPKHYRWFAMMHHALVSS